MAGGMKPLQTNTVLEDHGDWVLLDISTKSHPDATMKIDKEDLPKFPGRILFGGTYPVAIINRKTEYVHRVIMQYPVEVDHINRIKTDNRKKNLRSSTRSEQGYNKAPPTRNTSGIAGVSWEKRRGYWRVRMANKEIGSSKDFFEACCIRKGAENQLKKEKP